MTKSIIQRFFVFTIAVLVTAIAVVLYFLISNKAPLLYGKVDFQVSYKKDLFLDIYYPTSQKFAKSPVILYFHGGAWVTGIKGSVNTNKFNGAFNRLRANGYTVVSAEYTLAKEGYSPFPDCIRDGYDVIKWIENNADSLNLDLDNFGLMGESAGGQIAMLNAFADPINYGLRKSKPNLKYVVDIYGPTDLYNLYKSPTIDSVSKFIQKFPEPIQKQLDIPKRVFGFDPELDTAKAMNFALKFSPLTYLSKDVPPMLIIHGDEDILVPIKQSRALQAGLVSLGIKSEFHAVQGMNHAFRGATKEQKDSVQFWISDFIMKQYSSRLANKARFIDDSNEQEL
ncbi:alpha/beta hydrolase [Reichenbachiella versicolor]|uniref:alpha/beta hydrolase n=1 Tax=Reichenbachiella versicolor TaxID=1821036 RepID=UPI000D6DFE36|nr:alpha/beta hydrolase [Reichenbachiella versicolor]